MHRYGREFYSRELTMRERWVREGENTGLRERSRDSTEVLEDDPCLILEDAPHREPGHQLVDLFR